MNRASLLTMIAFLVPSSLPLTAADLSKIDRAIGKEPAYQSKPKYCLLVFGPEAKTRVWLVLDGDVLYVDRKADGDLTEQDQRFSKKGTSYFVDDLPASYEGHQFSSRLDVAQGSEGEETRCKIECWTKDSRGFRTSGLLVFANRPQEAPVVNVQGPLTFRIMDWNNPSKPSRLMRGDQENVLSILVGTPVFGGKHDVFVTFLEPKRRVDDYPVVEVEFPGGMPKAKSIVVRAAVRL
jgi:hypothetical protein